MAEYFRDEQGQDVLLFIDNIFRFTQAGSEVSTLLAACPRRWVTSPRWPTRWASCRAHHLHPRPVHHPMRAVYVPADDYTDPAPATTFAHLDATTELSRAVFSKGIFPAVDPLASSSTILTRSVVGDEHYRVAAEVIRTAATRNSGHHRHPRHRRAFRGRTSSWSTGPVASAVPEPEHDGPPSSSPVGRAPEHLKDRRAFDQAVKGDFDHVPGRSSLGGLDDLAKSGRRREAVMRHGS